MAETEKRLPLSLEKVISEWRNESLHCGGIHRKDEQHKTRETRNILP